MQDLSFTVTELSFAFRQAKPLGYSLTVNGRKSHGLTLILAHVQP